jgi:type I restriction enzyme S subunit
MEKTKNIPSLRFPEFEGEWGNRKINQILSIGSGRDYKHLDNGDVPVYGTGGLMTMVNSYLYDGDTVCIGRKGTIDRPMYFSGKIWTVDTLFYTHSFKESNPKFIYNLFQRVNWKQHNEAGGVPSLSKSTIEQISLLLPKLPEQLKIASFLTTVEDKLQALKQKKTLLEQYKKGVMQKIFSQEIRFKDNNGNDYPDWEEKKLGECLNYIQPTKYLVSSTEYDNSYNTPVLTAGKTFILGYTNETNGIFENNLPVIIFDDFTTATQFVDFPFKAKSSAMKILIANQGIDIKFIYEAMGIMNYEVGGHERHWISKFAHLDILVPCIQEQTNISNYLSAIDDKIKQCKEQIVNTEAWKKGLLQQMFC